MYGFSIYNNLNKAQDKEKHTNGNHNDIDEQKSSGRTAKS
jgi:hypothetical protein